MSETTYENLQLDEHFPYRIPNIAPCPASSEAEHLTPAEASKIAMDMVSDILFSQSKPAQI